MNNVELAQRIRTNLETPLQNFITDQRDQRKLVRISWVKKFALGLILMSSKIQAGVDKQQRNKQLHTTHVYKVSIDGIYGLLKMVDCASDGVFRSLQGKGEILHWVCKNDQFAKPARDVYGWSRVWTNKTKAWEIKAWSENVR